MAQTLEGETEGVDEVDTRPHEGIAEFEAQQIVLGLSGAVLDGVQQGRVNAGQPGQHLGVAPVALAFATGDGVQLARVGNDHRGPVLLKESADPRAVRPGFQRHRGEGELGEQFRQCRTGVGQRPLANDLTAGIQNADVMTPVTKIKAKGEPAGSNGRG